MLQTRVVNHYFFNEEYQEYPHEISFSPKSRKIGIISLLSSINSYDKNDKIYPFAQHYQFSIFQPGRNIIVGCAKALG